MQIFGFWEQGVAGSNPAAPTNFKTLYFVQGLFLYPHLSSLNNVDIKKTVFAKAKKGLEVYQTPLSGWPQAILPP